MFESTNSFLRKNHSFSHSLQNAHWFDGIRIHWSWCFFSIILFAYDVCSQLFSNFSSYKEYSLTFVISFLLSVIHAAIFQMRQNSYTLQQTYLKELHRHLNLCELIGNSEITIVIYAMWTSFHCDSFIIIFFKYIFNRRIINCSLKKIPDLSFLSTGTILNMVWVNVRILFIDISSVLSDSQYDFCKFVYSSMIDIFFFNFIFIIILEL